MNSKRSCLRSIKVGDVLHITCNRVGQMVFSENYSFIFAFKVVTFSRHGQPVVLSKYSGNETYATGTLVKIEKKK